MLGPHDFTVRENCARRNATPRPPHPALNVRDDAYAPHRAGMRGGKHELRKKRSSIFSARRLDHQISLDLLAKFVFWRERFRCDRVVLKASSMPNRRTMQVIWPTARLHFADILASQILARMCHQKFHYIGLDRRAQLCASKRTFGRLFVTAA